MSKAGESILRGAREAHAYARGEDDGLVAHVPDRVDVKAVRRKVRLSQAKLAARLGFGPDALRNWEQGRRRPDMSARAFLIAIDREPEAVQRALSAPPGDEPAKRPAKAVPGRARRRQ